MRPPLKHPEVQRALYEDEVKRRLLALHDDLARHDENLAAYRLLDSCVPYFLRADPEIVELREQGHLKILHLLDPDAYTAYYGDNPKEAPFEQMYGVRPEDAAAVLPRVAEAHRRIAAFMVHRRLAPGMVRALDLACNDGMLGVYLWHHLGIVTDGIDLNPSCLDRARSRYAAAGIPTAELRQEDATKMRPPETHDVVVAFELIEHVAYPDSLIRSIRGSLRDEAIALISTPYGAVEQGALTKAEYRRVEPKGHVRAWTDEDFRREIEKQGLRVRDLVLGEDGIMVAEAM